MLGDFTTRRNAWYFQAHHHEIDRILISAMQPCNMAYFKLIYCTFWCNDYENNVNEGVKITLLTHSLFHMHAPLNSHGSHISLCDTPLPLSLSEFIIVSLSWTLLKYYSSSFPPPFLYRPPIPPFIWKLAELFFLYIKKLIFIIYAWLIK